MQSMGAACRSSRTLGQAERKARCQVPGEGWQLRETERGRGREVSRRLEAEPEPRPGEGGACVRPRGAGGGARAPTRGGRGQRPTRGLPRSDCRPARLRSKPRTRRGTPASRSPARGGNAPGTPEPRTRPAGCPHLAQESSQTLAVELHVQPEPGSSWTSCNSGCWTAAAEDQTSRRGRRPRPSPDSKVGCAPGSAALRLGVASPRLRDP